MASRVGRAWLIVGYGIIMVASSLVAGSIVPLTIIFPFLSCQDDAGRDMGFVAIGAAFLLGVALVVSSAALPREHGRRFAWWGLALPLVGATIAALPWLTFAVVFPNPHWPALILQLALMLMLAIAPTLPGVGALIAALAIPASSRHRLMFVVPAVIAGTLCGAAVLTSLLILTRFWRCG